jgi:NADH-quinone oxidoreductase subunit L
MPTFVVAAAPLWLAPALLLLAAAGLVVLGPRLTRPGRLAAAAAVAALVVLAASAPPAWSGATVLSPLLRLARVGSLDLALGMALDRTSLLVAAGLLVATLASALLPGPDREDHGAVARTLASAACIVSGALADGFPLLLLALSTLIVLTPLAGGRNAAPGRFFGAAGAGVVTLALGATLLFWSLGGRWLDDARFLADFRARFIVAEEQKDATAPRTSAPNARGTLTFVSHPGARIYDGVADEAQLLRTDPIAISPAIGVPLIAGLHKIAIAPGDGAVVAGDGLEVALVDIVKIRENDETVIVLQGPTVTFHEIARQVDPTAFATRRLFRMPAATILAACFLGALLLFALALRAPLLGRAGALAGAGMFGIAAVALARVAPVLIQAPAVGVMFAAVAVIVAALWARAAMRSPDAIGTEVLGAAGLLAVAAGSASPVAPVCASVSLALAALAMNGESSPAAAKPVAAKKKRKKGAEAVAPEPAIAPIGPTSPSGLLLAAVAGAPVPGGVFALGASGVACAFAGMGAGNLVSAACIVATWACVTSIVWRARPDSTASQLWLGAASLVAAPLIALALSPWNVPANVAGDARVGLAFVGFAVALVGFFFARRRAVATAAPTPERDGENPVVLGLGRALDRLLGAPLDILALPFSKAPPAEPQQKESA